MTSIILLGLASSTIFPPVGADSWADFTNNLATDLAPLITLFGEQVTKQYLSESVNIWDNIIFALAPLGILTAVVSAIRVCGSPSLRAFIGRAQEGPGNVEVELLSSTSETTAELWNDGGIARVFGKPRILEVVKWHTNEESYGYPGAPNATAGIGLMDDAVVEGVWCTSKTAEDGGTFMEKSETRSPNLSLNIGIRSRPRWWFRGAMMIGSILQIGILILAWPATLENEKVDFFSGVMGYAGLTRYHFSSAFKRDGKIPQPYAFPLTLIGLIMVSLGMFLCAHLIERSTTKTHYQRKSDSKLYWVQPGGQKVGDQVFHAFIGMSDSPRYLTSYKRSKGPSRDTALLSAVTITMMGFILEFVGLRAMHPSATLALLGAALLMAIIRASLRTQRMTEDDNLLPKDIQRSVQGHELDCLAMELENVEKIDMHEWPSAKRQGEILLSDGQSDPRQSTHATTGLSPSVGDAAANLAAVAWSVIEVSRGTAKVKGLQMKRTNKPSPGGHQTSLNSDIPIPPSTLPPTPARFDTHLLTARARLARLTSDEMGIGWDDLPVRQTARQLQNAIEGVMDLFSGALEEKPAEDLRCCYWPMYLMHLPNGRTSANSEVYLRMRRNRHGDKWKADGSELEALVGLCTWTVLPSGTSARDGAADPIDIRDRRLIAQSTANGDLEPTIRAYRVWVPGQSELIHNVIIEGGRSVNINDSERPSRYFGWGLLTAGKQRQGEQSPSEEYHSRPGQPLDSQHFEVLYVPLPHVPVR